MKHIISVGAAKVDITPEYGTQLGGDIGRYRPVEEIRDRLYARIIVIKANNKKLCLITCDTDCIIYEIGQELRKTIAEQLKAEPEDVMLHCSQSHSSPRVGPFLLDHCNIIAPKLKWVCGDTPAYNDLFVSEIVKGVKKAMNQLVPVRVKFARTIDNRCASNRRYVMRDGRVKTHPANCDENILYCEGPIDPEASLLLFEDFNSRPVAGILHYTCHPIHGYPKRYVSADWPGIWSESVSRKLGNDCVVGCLNGFCGNISPRDHSNPDHRNPDYSNDISLDLMLKHLDSTGQKLIDNLQAVNAFPIMRSSHIMNIPWERPPKKTISNAKELLKEHPMPIFLDSRNERISWDWVLAVRDLDKQHIIESDPDYKFEIQVFRIGEAAVIGWPGEPFVEAQLDLKLRAKAKYLLAGHECNSGDCGYLPTKKAIKNGGYEVSIGRKLIAGTLEKATEKTIETINELFN
ncbi:MAG: neutral/alkaline non-lysosomal ceramidase N-terminal domain-containing protein [Victivallaceae bacterium]